MGGLRWEEAKIRLGFNRFCIQEAMMRQLFGIWNQAHFDTVLLSEAEEKPMSDGANTMPTASSVQ